MIDQQSQIALGLLSILIIIFLIDKFGNKIMKFTEVNDQYKKEIDDILNKDEYKVKGRFE